MSAIIQNFIIHQLQIEDQQLKARTRSDIFDVSADIEMFAQQLNTTFNNKPVRGIAGFIAEDPNAEMPSFHALLNDYLSGEQEFQGFSVEVCDRLIKAMAEQATADTGFVVISQYQFLATDYLLIALLDTKEHVEITSSLELNIATHLDLSKMQLAARIDLSMLQAQEESKRYISFIKGRAGRKISDFFLEFMGCEEEVDVKLQNKMLLEKVETYMEAEELEPEEKQQSRAKLVDYYKEQLDAGEEVSVTGVAKTLSMDDQKQDFSAFNQQTESPVEESFQADRTAMKTLSKFSGAGGGVMISFDRKLLGDAIVYVPETESLVIKKLPPNLKDQLLKWQN